jgi:hypothetical protein
MNKKNGVTYTEEMLQILESAAKEGPFTLERCNKLAELEIFSNAGIVSRLIVAKVRAMGFEYKSISHRTSKPVEGVTF